MLVCSVEGCEKLVTSRGVCSTHYMQLRRSGLVPVGTRARASVEDRFWRYVDKAGDCWLWTSTKKTSSGYGQIGAGGVGGKNLLAHRLSYEMHHGPIPDGYVVMHMCDNPGCVNPAHLRAATASENIKDAYQKRRKFTPFKQGAEHHTAVLTEEIVREIRRSPLKNVQLSRLYGCSPNAVSSVRLRKTWKHVT